MSEKKFINLSNHPAVQWMPEQKEAAERYGEILDYPFPVVKADATEEGIRELGAQTYMEVMRLNPAVVMCQGEFTLTFDLVRRFQEAGIPCLSACSERISAEIKNPDGVMVKTSMFRFVKFRRYGDGMYGI